ncbi:hypothetical protein ORI20_28670 [Mycobacterium sp. CVI_P3]|uniref:Immunity factor for TNT n=1 Tax=Mycobacterium pinniadriaticum TaxID=2994102 RepID=A0ABT3SMB2_9MYCO|nr:hypothetical protein [Mycobacterium pinniadriaticum]MCX2934248.1 hypothetical protein [Mycobacterium pinniadriaticum]MCX2940670.1 hypothetical protein [Mycobacterium pinniadriaticum]
MTTDFSDLAASWQLWAGRAGMTDATVEGGEGGESILFKSDDEAYELRHDDGWWVIDEIDDRGRRYTDTARFSTITLAHKFLVWRWASTTRTALGAKQLGPYFHSLGMNQDVDPVPAARTNFVELHLADGVAVLPTSNAAMFSHILELPMSGIAEIVGEGLRY